jgi:hypothetical protein
LGRMSEMQTRVLRLAALAQDDRFLEDDSFFEKDGVLLGLIAREMTRANEWQT